MRLPDFITFTGLDARTDLDRAVALTRRYPIEWGVLFSPTRQGRDNRYPDDNGTLSRIFWSPLARSEKNLGALAAHLCGEHSRHVMSGLRPNPPPPVDLWFCRRVQVNHAAPNPAAITKFRRGWGVPHGIAQTTAMAFPQDTRVEWLFDRSGGRGAAPGEWPRHPGGNRRVGYAGGIGPDNVVAVLESIAADGPYWIDMETGVRTDNWLDLDKCEAVCRAVYGEAAKAA
jgi:hypothetical protein